MRLAHAVSIATAIFTLSRLAAADSSLGPEINPYECLGRYEAATRARSIAQMEAALAKRLDPLFEEGEPATVRAMKLCVIALLKSRVGDSDAAEYYARAVQENPEEPGYEMFYGGYYSGFRGAHRPVLELAEKHYYRALEKLEALRRAGKFREYHAIVEEWVRKRLLVLYQEDGQPLLPPKAYPQHSNGLDALGLFASSQVSASVDTRDFYYHDEMRAFSQEANFVASDLRARSITPLQIYNIVRAPLRLRIQDRVRLRHNALGAFDFIHEYSHSPKSMITSFYLNPPPDFSISLNDVTVQQLGGAYSRVFPLYPLFDARIEASVQRVKRKGVVEFLPNREETFNLYEIKPSVSRFLGSDKLSIDGVYVLLDMADILGGITDERQRKEFIRAARIEYAVYRPFVFPAEEVRTATRGWYFYAGALQDDKVYGLRTVTTRDIYGGSRFEGSGIFDFTLQGTYLTSRTTFVDPTVENPIEQTDPAQTFANFRTNAVIQMRVINPDALPGIPPSTAGFVPDMLNIVVPISHDQGVTGRKDYENFRGGVELWGKVFGTGIGGTAVLATVGYDWQYFYNIKRSMHMVHAALRVGWGDL
jgi:hypothetical protein